MQKRRKMKKNILQVPEIELGPPDPKVKDLSTRPRGLVGTKGPISKDL